MEPLRLALEGEFDMSHTERLSRMLRPVQGATDVVIDLSNTIYFDSTALSCLIHAAKRRAEGAAKVVLKSPPAHIRRVLTIAKLERVFDVID